MDGNHRWSIFLILLLNISQCFRILKAGRPGFGLNRQLHNEQIDNMMFECAIYNDNLSFKSNVDINRKSQKGKGSETEDFVKSFNDQINQGNLKNRILKNNINKIKFPIVGRIKKPETKYLKDIYYILEENNRALEEGHFDRRSDPIFGEHSEIDKNALSSSPSAEVNERLHRKQENTVDGQNSSPRRVLIQPRNIYSMFKDKSHVVNMFPTRLISKSPIIPGQISTIALQDEHKELFVEEIKNRNIFGIFVAFVANEEPNKPPELSPHSILCELIDISELDLSGRVVVRGVERFSIDRILRITEASINAELSIIQDDELELRNRDMTHENIRILEKLYDRCNLLEAEYRRLCGSDSDVSLIESRLSYREKLDDMISHIPLEDGGERKIMALSAFAAMEFHADVESRVWAVNIRNTEERITCVKLILEKKCDVLRALIYEVQQKLKDSDDIQLPD